MRNLNISNILALFTVNFYILEGQALKSFYILEAQALKHWKNINDFGQVCLFERHLIIREAVIPHTLNYSYKLVESVPCFSLSFHFVGLSIFFINLWPFLWEKFKRKGLIGFLKSWFFFTVQHWWNEIYFCWNLWRQSVVKCWLIVRTLVLFMKLIKVYTQKLAVTRRICVQPLAAT